MEMLALIINEMTANLTSLLRPCGFGYNRISEAEQHFLEKMALYHGVRPELIFKLIHGKEPQNELEKSIVEDFESRLNPPPTDYEAEENTEKILKIASLIESAISDDNSLAAIHLYIVILADCLMLKSNRKARRKVVDVSRRCVHNLNQYINNGRNKNRD